MEKNIKSMGGTTYIIIDKVMRALSGISVDDVVEIKCSKGKIILIKKVKQEVQ